MFTLYAQTSTQIAMSLPAWLDLASVAVGGISGALVAKERKLDPIGFIGLSMLCGLGGGLVRDMAMQVGSVYMLDNPYAIPATVVIGLAVFFFGRLFEKVPNLLEWVDIISVGLFALGGTDKAIVHALLPVSAILMGTLTGVGGGRFEPSRQLTRAAFSWATCRGSSSRATTTPSARLPAAPCTTRSSFGSGSTSSSRPSCSWP